jgi:Site-specific recombinase XerC
MYLKSASTFFNWLVRNRQIKESPMIGLRIRQLPRNRRNRDKAATDAEFHQLQAYARSRIVATSGTVFLTAVRNYAILMTLADTGARRGGIVSMTTTDIDLTTNEAWVTEKGDKSRPVGFGNETAHALNQWLRYRPAADTAALFVATRGQPTPLYDGLITQIIHRMCRAAGLDRVIGPHHFRHRKGHQLADAGIPPTIAATLLGHENVQTTLNHYYPEDYATALDVAHKLAEPSRTTDENGVIRLDHKKPG